MKYKILLFILLFLFSLSLLIYADPLVSKDGTTTIYNLESVDIPIKNIVNNSEPTVENVDSDSLPVPINNNDVPDVELLPVEETTPVELISPTDTPSNQALLLPSDLSNSFSIIDVNYLDFNNEICNKLTNNGFVKSVTIRKNINELLPAYIIVSLYDNMRFIEFKMLPIQEDIISGQDYTFDFDIELPDDISRYKLKAFVWDGFSSLMPYSDVYNTADIVVPNILLTKNLNDYTMTELLLLLIFLVLFLNFVKSLFYMRGVV